MCHIQVVKQILINFRFHRSTITSTNRIHQCMIRLSLLFLCLPLIGWTQKQGNIWYFGNHAGISFNSGSPVALTNGALTFPSGQGHNEGSSVISDSSGSLFVLL